VSTTTYAPKARFGGAAAAWQLLARLQARIPLFQLVALAIVFTYGATTLPGLASWDSIKGILVFAALVGLASAGQTLLILMGGFDLSISGFIVASALMVTTVKAKYGLPFGVALLIAVVAAGVLGALAGNICHRFKIQPLIVTLAVGAIAVGLVQAQTGGLLAGSTPSWLSRLTSPGTDTLGVDVPPMVVIWAVVAVLMGIFLHRTVPGRRIFATGANPGAAENALVNTRRVWTIAFAFSAIASVLVGLLVGGFAGSVDSTVGDPYLFQSVVAVIVGGTVFGGPGDYTRTVVGALFITVVNVVAVGHGANAADQQIIYGVAILLAVTLYGRERRLRDRI
jgi:ribose transport system permease protein